MFSSTGMPTLTRGTLSRPVSGLRRQSCPTSEEQSQLRAPEAALFKSCYRVHLTWSHFQLTFFLGCLTPKPRATLRKPMSGTVWWPCFDNVQTDVNSFNNIPSLSAHQGTQTIQEALTTGLPCWNRKDITMYTCVCEEPVFMATQVSAQEELMPDRQYN